MPTAQEGSTEKAEWLLGCPDMGAVPCDGKAEPHLGVEFLETLQPPQQNKRLPSGSRSNHRQDCRMSSQRGMDAVTVGHPVLGRCSVACPKSGGGGPWGAFLDAVLFLI